MKQLMRFFIYTFFIDLPVFPQSTGVKHHLRSLFGYLQEKVNI